MRVRGRGSGGSRVLCGCLAPVLVNTILELDHSEIADREWQRRVDEDGLQQRVETWGPLPCLELLGARLDLGGVCRRGGMQHVIEGWLGEGIRLAWYLDGPRSHGHAHAGGAGTVARVGCRVKGGGGVLSKV